MRTATFEVPAHHMGDFSEKLSELCLSNSITGKTEDGDIEVEVYYEKEDSELVDELEEYVEELTADDEDDDEA